MEQEAIHIERLTYGRNGVGRLASGKTVFVEESVPGDELLVEITKSHASYSEGVVREIITPSEHRVDPPCPWVHECGGCSWQHIAYGGQLQAKRDNVINALTRIGKWEKDKAEQVVANVIPSRREFKYRNKLELSTGFDKEKGFSLGFKKEKTDKIVSPDYCMLAHKVIQKAPKALRGALRYAQGDQDLGIYRVGVRQSDRTHDLEVALWTTPGAFPRASVAKLIESALKTSSVVRVIADPGKQRKIKQVEVLSGKGYWEEQLRDCRFKTSAPSFFQVNSEQAEVMIDQVVNALDIDESSVVADLYAGGGTFSIPLAQRFDSVISIEAASSSVKDLRRNADENGVFVDVVGGDSARELKELGSLDALVVDPPRNGLAEGVAGSIAAAGPRKVAYVSCDPSTWARDVLRLEEAGYLLHSVQPIDLFPQTYHVELVSIFEKEDQ